MTRAIDMEKPNPNTGSRRFQVFTGFHTDVGRQRKKNEDALLEAAVGLGYLLVVADGMGGHDFGERASSLAIDTILHHMQPPSDDPMKQLIDSLAAANRTVYTEAKSIGRTMGATCVAALISKGRLYVAHAGDARAYLLRASTLYLLTRDHSFVQEIADAKGPNLANNLPQNFSHIVSRSLGTQPSVQVAEREPFSLSAGDVILLCSDGLTNMVNEDSIRLTLAGTTPREAAKRLVDLANEAGGHDNITVIVARIDTEASLVESRNIDTQDLRSLFIKAKDGMLHPVISSVIDPTTWTITALVVDLRNVEKGATCTLSVSEMGPLVFGKQALEVPQSTEALLEMGHLGLWKSDAKQSQPPGPLKNGSKE